MFGLSLGGKLIQGSAERTWNCISQIANLVWYKFNTRQQIMPRQRRRHHSKSKSRSRSQSHDKDRDAKRRKIDLYESPNPKRSVSPDDATSNDQKVKEAVNTSPKKISENPSDSESQTSGECVENLCEAVLDEPEQETILIESDSESQEDVDQVTPKKVPQKVEAKPSSARRTTQTTLISFYKNSDKVNTKSKTQNDKSASTASSQRENETTPSKKTQDDANSKKLNEKKAATPSTKTEINKMSTTPSLKVLNDKNATPSTKTEDNANSTTPSLKKLNDKIPAEIKEKATTPSSKALDDETFTTPSTKKRNDENAATPASKKENDKSTATPSTKVQNDKNATTPSSELQNDTNTTTSSAKKRKTSNATTPLSKKKDDKNQSSINPANSNESQVTPKRQSTRTTKGKRDTEPKCTSSTEEKSQTPSEDVPCIELSEESEDLNETPSNSAPVTPLPKDKVKSNGETTPLRGLTPKQQQRKLESEKKRQQKEKEREEREKLRNEEREKKEAEKLKKKEQKQKEIELKNKEREEKEELKKREKEKKEEEKLKKQQEKEEERLKKQQEKEEEKLKKQQEIDEKNKEKMKEDEKKQKAAAAFVSFFVPKKAVNTEEEKKVEHSMAFMPFEVKSDMKLPPSRRKPLTENEKAELLKLLEKNDPKHSYLRDLKSIKPRTCHKTWPYQETDDDVTILDDDEDVGEKICGEKPTSERMRAKFLKFRENQRPAYYGTWRKKSAVITGRRPFGKEEIFDYEVDSDDDWEEEEQGENLEVGSDDDKENETENEDYEVDNEFFVPHGHLSEDEVDDEENSKLSPESLKQKLKLLKDAFDQDMQSKTQKIKPRSIGCIWYNKTGDNVDEAIDRHLHPLRIITDGQINIDKRSGNEVPKKRKSTIIPKDIPENLMPALLKLIHGSSDNRKSIAEKFLNYMETNNAGLEISKAQVLRHIGNVARWTKPGLKKKICWVVNEDAAEKYNVDLVTPTS